MNKSDACILIAKNINVFPLLRALEQHPALWDQITARQKYPGSAHRDTKCIFVRWCPTPTMDAAFSEIPAVEYPDAAALAPAWEEAVGACMLSIAYVSDADDLRQACPEIGRVIVTNLQKGGMITPHVDEGAYADHYDRFHLVLRSLPGNQFNVGPYSFIGQPGELWWFNHKFEHSVVNDSDADRWHLIMDIVSPFFRSIRDKALENKQAA